MSVVFDLRPTYKPTCLSISLSVYLCIYLQMSVGPNVIPTLTLKLDSRLHLDFPCYCSKK